MTHPPSTGTGIYSNLLNRLVSAHRIVVDGDAKHHSHWINASIAADVPATCAALARVINKRWNERSPWTTGNDQLRDTLKQRRRQLPRSRQRHAIRGRTKG